MFGGVVAWATGWIGSRSEEQVGLILAALVAPTLISALLDLPRPVKHVSRFFLGVATVSAFILLFATHRWVVRIAILGVYFAVKLPLQRLRQRRMDTELARSKERNDAPY
jgi:MFS-type transporter involved in bile tolerance (Atg22 family)